MGLLPEPTIRQPVPSIEPLGSPISSPTAEDRRTAAHLDRRADVRPTGVRPTYGYRPASLPTDEPTSGRPDCPGAPCSRWPADDPPARRPPNGSPPDRPTSRRTPPGPSGRPATRSAGHPTPRPPIARPVDARQADRPAYGNRPRTPTSHRPPGGRLVLRPSAEPACGRPGRGPTVSRWPPRPRRPWCESGTPWSDQ